MAFDKIIDSSKLNNRLTNIANTIRSKGGTDKFLNFNNGDFESAINKISTLNLKIEELDSKDNAPINKRIIFNQRYLDIPVNFSKIEQLVYLCNIAQFQTPVPFFAKAWPETEGYGIVFEEQLSTNTNGMGTIDIKDRQAHFQSKLIWQDPTWTQLPVLQMHSIGSQKYLKYNYSTYDINPSVLSYFIRLKICYIPD